MKLNDELRQKLAAEYALGTLRGRARERLERWMRDDPELAKEVRAWEARLAPMADAVAPVEPRRGSGGRWSARSISASGSPSGRTLPW